MADIFVTQLNDNGTGTTPGTLSWAILQANSNAGADRIVLKTDVTVQGVMKRLLNSDITITGDDPTTGAIETKTISGNNQFRPLFVKSGTIQLEQLTLRDGTAQGGNSQTGGGGGAGMGGALFIYSGTVSVNEVTFANNRAIGGTTTDSGSSDSGGGGMWGIADDWGGGGLFAGSTSSSGGYGGYGLYGGYRGRTIGNFLQNLVGNTTQTNGGFGGGGASTTLQGGNGGFGGGGGAGTTVAGFGGFGGGGGGGVGGGGDGGYGGGGGGGVVSPGAGGYGGGNSATGLASLYGGGGAGMGGAVFVRSGSLTVSDSTFTDNSVQGGLGANSGSGLGGAVFAMKSTAQTLSNQNAQGMPGSQPNVTLLSVTLANSTAPDASSSSDAALVFASGDDQNNQDVFGNTIARPAPEVATLTPNLALLDEGNVGTGTFTVTLDFSQTMDMSIAPTIVFPTANEDPTNSLSFDSGSWSDTNTYVATYNVSNAGETISDIDVRVEAAQNRSGAAQIVFNESDVFSISMTSTAPEVMTLTPNLVLIEENNVGAGTFTLTVDFDRAMDTAIAPTIAFPTANEDPTNTLSFDSGSWSDADTYIATYSVSDVDETISDIDVRVTGGQSSTGAAPSSFTEQDAFSIATDSAAPEAPTVVALMPNLSLLEEAHVGTSTFTLTLDFSQAMDISIAPAIAFPTASEDPTTTISFNSGSWNDADTYIATYNVSDADDIISNIDALVTGARNVSGTVQDPLSRSNVFSINTGEDSPISGTVLNDQFEPDPNSDPNSGLNDSSNSDSNSTSNSNPETVAVSSEAVVVPANQSSLNSGSEETVDDLCTSTTPRDDIAICPAYEQVDDIIAALPGDDVVRTRGGSDVIFGNTGNDILLGDAGNDSLWGGQGSDVIDGGTGDDFITGDRGSDILTGGTGRDTFQFRTGDGSDIITDFTPGEDTFTAVEILNESGLGNALPAGSTLIANFSIGEDRLGIVRQLRFSELTVEKNGIDTTVSFRGERLVTLSGVAGISAADFVDA